MSTEEKCETCKGLEDAATVGCMKHPVRVSVEDAEIAAAVREIEREGLHAKYFPKGAWTEEGSEYYDEAMWEVGEQEDADHTECLAVGPTIPDALAAYRTARGSLGEKS